MTAIRMVSIIHILWGLCLLILPAPRPFGALEPYFSLIPPVLVGALFLIGGTLPLLAIHLRAFRCLACAVAPQQLILFYGTSITIIDVVTTFDVRSVLALCYLAPMTVSHFLEGIDLAAHLWGGGGDVAHD